MAESNIAEQLDTILAQFFSSWNLVSSLLVLAVLLLLAYPLFTAREPDTHPFLLARQAQIAPIRHEGQSAAYRSIEIPHGYPLRAGLGVKDAGVPRWSAGRPGDLRDVWRQAVRGVAKEDGTLTGDRGKIQTVLGREKVVDHSFEDLTLGINVIGQYIKRNNGQAVAVCLSNSVELLSAVFAGSFYGFSTTLLPHGLPGDKFASLLSKTTAEYLIAEAGSIDLNAVVAANKSIKNIIWVTKPGSQHLDWSESPAGFTVTSWQDLVEKNQRTSNSEVLPLDKDSQVPPISIFCQISGGTYELVKYTSDNLISATAGLLATLPRSYKLTHTDTVLPTTSLIDSYTLAWVFAALYSNSTVVINSVAGDAVKLELAATVVKPTVLITSPKTIASYLVHPSTIHPSGLTKFNRTRRLQAGNLPAKTATPAIPALANLRVVLIPQSVTAAKPSPVLTSSDLHTLRLALGVRIGYALTNPLIAGAVSQTNILDYRDKGNNVVNVGPPLSSVEFHVEGDDELVGNHRPRGKLSVRGPSVVGGKTLLDLDVQVDQDNTILLR